MRTQTISSISLPDSLLADVSRLARDEKRSRSAVMREALARYVAARRWRALQTRAVSLAHRRGIRTESQVDDLIHAYRKNALA